MNFSGNSAKQFVGGQHLLSILQNCSMMATRLCTSLYDIKTFCCCQTQILFTLFIAELNIVTPMLNGKFISFDLVFPIH